MRTTSLKLSVAAFLLFSPVYTALALESDYSKPVNVLSVEQFADLKANKVIFSGNVVATQGTMKITADKVEITRDDEGKLKMVTAYGSPTTFEQMMENGKPIHSRSATINYEPNKNLIVLTGKATVWQGESRMVGERIEYNIKTQTMRANNKTKSQGGRVSSTFIPSDFQQQKK